MLQDKLAYASKAIQHAQYSSQWGCIRRKIEEELSVPPEARKDCSGFLKYIRQDINKVSMDGNNTIPEFIRNLCYKKYNGVTGFDMPDICGKMEHTKIYVKKPIDDTIYNGGGSKLLPGTLPVEVAVLPGQTDGKS